MSSIGIPEVVLVLVVALLVLGPDKLPGAARQAGRFVSDLRGQASDLQRQFDSAVRDDKPHSAKADDDAYGEARSTTHPGTDGFELIDRHAPRPNSAQDAPAGDDAGSAAPRAERYPKSDGGDRED